MLIWVVAKNADPDKYVWTGYGIGFYLRSELLLPDGGVGKIAIIFGADMSSSVPIDNKGKDILILDEELDYTTLTAAAKYLISFTQVWKRLVLSQHYKISNSSLFVHATKIY